jgi:MFS family permease
VKFSAGYKSYALGLMTAVYTLNQVDRGLMNILLQSIKQDLQLSDTQLGLVTGIAFAFFYATAGVPIARWADRSNRASITAMAIGLWGLTVMASVFVANFVHLIFARVAAAVGESGCKPPTYSLVGDYFPSPAERTRAMSVYWLAGPLATIISFVCGGQLNELYGWRTTFLLMGIPGLVLAVLVKLTLVETRGNIGNGAVSRAQVPPFRAVLRILWQQRTSRHLCLGLITLYLMGSGLSPWYAAFMIRSHGLGTGEVGLWLGLTTGVGGIVGVLCGGYVAARWFSNNERNQMRMSALAVASFMPFFLAFVLVPNKNLALLALIPQIAVFNFFMGPTYAVMQRLVPDSMRATVLAVVLLLVNLIGMGIGPQIVGILSDLFNPTFGQESLRYAMSLMSVVALWSAWHFWRAGQTASDDLLLASQTAHVDVPDESPDGLVSPVAAK